jgi:hypothetical protein
MMDDNTRFDKFVKVAKNNWVLAIIGVLAVAIITISQFGESMTKIINMINNEKTFFAEVSVHSKEVALTTSGDKETFNTNSRGNSLPLVPPILDIKIVNNSDKAIFIDSINILATKLSFEPPIMTCMGAFFRPTGFYDLAINFEDEKQSHKLQVSHSIKAGEVDRISISVAADSYSGGTASFDLALKLEGIDDFSVSINSVEVELHRTPGTCGGSIRRDSYKILNTEA